MAKEGNWNSCARKGYTNKQLAEIFYPDEKVFVENSTYKRGSLKKRIINKNMIPHECAICSCPPSWMGKPMTLILDHINGANNDHRIENLRFVCSNCDSQLETYKSKSGVLKRKKLESEGARVLPPS